jgi:hypothetical protein
MEFAAVQERREVGQAVPAGTLAQGPEGKSQEHALPWRRVAKPYCDLPVDALCIRENKHQQSCSGISVEQKPLRTSSAGDLAIKG